ncbi:MAG: hypothetical protein NT038_06590 [Euryarchaeota archaeon]|nr:hypothetical protein [Euryarchaeota archaeon]
MKNKTLKIMGIGAGALFVLIAFVPACTAQVQGRWVEYGPVYKEYSVTKVFDGKWVTETWYIGVYWETGTGGHDWHETKILKTITYFIPDHHAGMVPPA